SGTQAADDPKPCGDGLMQERGLTVNDRFLLERNPDVGRIAAQSLAEESRRRYADDGEGMTLDRESGTEDRWIAGVSGLPRAMTENGNRRRGGDIVVGGKDAAGEGADAQRGEIVPGHIFG